MDETTENCEITPVAKETIESEPSLLDNAAEKYKAEECGHISIRIQESSEVNIVDGVKSCSDVSLHANEEDKKDEADPIAKEKELMTYVRKNKRGSANPLV